MMDLEQRQQMLTIMSGALALIVLLHVTVLSVDYCLRFAVYNLLQSQEMVMR